MDKIDKLAKAIISSQSSESKTSPYDTTAEVVLVEGGTAWVKIAGGVDRTPAKLLVDAKKGDSVRVHIAGGNAYVTGNATAPPTDDTKANVADAKATEAKAVAVNARNGATRAKVKADAASETAETAVKTAEGAHKIADNTNQYFWHTESGTDTGAHITEIPQSAFLMNPENGGGNLLARSNGIAVRDGLTELATFGASEATIGETDGTYTKITPTALALIDSEGNKYLEIKDWIDKDGYVVAEFVGDGTQQYFSCGISILDDEDFIVTVDGVEVTSGVFIVSVDPTVLQFLTPPASGAEIVLRYIPYDPNGEGYKDFTFGTRSGFTEQDFGVTIGKNLILGDNDQTVIGKYNDGRSLRAFIIGNGTDKNHRSNALTVDWDGNVTISNHASPIGTVKYESLPSNKSVPNNASTELVRISLDKGVWVIVAGVRWAENTNGYRQLNVYGVSGSTEIHLLTAPASGHYTQMNFTRVLEITADDTPIYLNGRQTSGGALNALAGGGNWGTYLTAVRIK